MEQNAPEEQQLSFNYIYERELYLRCKRCNECLKAIVFTEIIVTLISLIFYSVVFAMSFTKQQQVSFHLTILTLSAFIVFGYLISFLILKRNFPSEQRASCKRVSLLYLSVILILTLIGFIILGKLTVDFLMIVQINEDRNKSEINYDWLLFYLDFLFSIIGLQLITTLFSMITFTFFLISVLFALTHSVVWLVTCKKRSLISNVLSIVEKKIEERKYKWQRFLNKFKTEVRTEEVHQACPICCQTFELKEAIYKLPCIEGKPLHFFHTKCLDIWSRSSAACPTCRTKFSQLT